MNVLNMIALVYKLILSTDDHVQCYVDSGQRYQMQSQCEIDAVQRAANLNTDSEHSIWKVNEMKCVPIGEVKKLMTKCE